MAPSHRAAALTVAALLSTSVAGAQAGRVAAPAWRLEVGAAAPGAAYAEDGEGGGVTGGVAPAIGAAAVWAAGAKGTAEIGARFSRSSLRVETGGVERDAGSATHVDLVAAVGYRLGSRVVLRGGAGISMVRGDDDVVPFRDGNDSPWHLAGEAGALVRLARTRPLGLALTVHMLQLGGATVGDPVAEGTLLRILLGVTYGR